MSPKSRTATVPENDRQTRGEIEAAICAAVTRFEQEYMGRGPRRIEAHLIDDLIIVRLRGVLSVAEQNLVATLPPATGRDLLKQVRTHLIETSRPPLEVVLRQITGCNVVSLHHDVSTTTGEEVVLFTLDATPEHRPGRTD